MELNEYIEKGGQKLRLGYTTGSCAAAAAKAAVIMLLTGSPVSQVRLLTPKGLSLILDIEDIHFRNKKDGREEDIPVFALPGSCKEKSTADSRPPACVSETGSEQHRKTSSVSPETGSEQHSKTSSVSSETGLKKHSKTTSVSLETGSEQDSTKLTSGSETGLKQQSINQMTDFPTAVSCAVRKDSGDDPDITNHALIYVEAALSDTPGIQIDGGEGVGRVTRPGLDQPVGNAAINSTPRRMIREAVLEALQFLREQEGNDFKKENVTEWDSSSFKKENVTEWNSSDPKKENVTEWNSSDPEKKLVSGKVNNDLKKESSSKRICSVPEKESVLLKDAHVCEKEFLQPSQPLGLKITVFVPQGRELAAKTFNPKLGIEGGISILGTSGIVEPMSDQALLDTIKVEVRVRKEEGLTILPAAPGNYGKNFFLEKYGFSLETSVTSSNFIYDTVLMAADAGFRHMLFVGHIGKLVKVAGGIRNTHSQYGDHRMEILTDITKEVIFRAGEENKNTDLHLNASLSRENEKEPLPQGKMESDYCGRSNTFENLCQELSDCVMTDQAVNILRKYGLDQPVLSEMTMRIQKVMQDWSGGRMQIEIVVFSNVHGELGRTENALEYMEILKRQISGI